MISNKFDIIILLNIGILFIFIEGSMRCIIGLILIGFSICIYLISKGYILLSLLLLLSLVSICIILYIIKYNTSNIYKSSSFHSILLILYSMILSMNHLDSNVINNIEIFGYILLFESNILIFFLIFILFVFLQICSKFSNKITICYQIHYWNIMNYVIMNGMILFGIALFLCYVPVIIRYKSKIYKSSNDIYEVGIGVNMSNSIFHSISINIGQYNIYYYIYIFIYLDLVINIIIISYFISITSVIIISFIIIFVSYYLV